MAALLLLGVGVAQAQTSKQAKKEAKMEARAQAKAQREAERDARDAMIKTEEMQAFLTAKKSINQMDFVLEGSQIQLRSGANFFYFYLVFQAYRADFTSRLLPQTQFGDEGL